MPQSLKSKIKKLRYQCRINEDEYYSLMKKIDGHDKEIRAEVIDEFKNMLIEGELYRCTDGNEYVDVADIEHCAEQLKGRNK